jgi:hypothetical protein
MTVEGHIENGQIVLNEPLPLPNGVKVRVSVQADRDQVDTEWPYPSLYDRLKSVAGKAKGLPADLAINHDHYLHGQPTRQ